MADHDDVIGRLDRRLPDAAASFAATEHEKDVLIGRVRYLRVGLLPLQDADAPLPDARVAFDVYGVSASAKTAYSVFEGTLTGGRPDEAFAEVELEAPAEVAYLAVRMAPVEESTASTTAPRRSRAPPRMAKVVLWVEAANRTDGPWLPLYEGERRLTANTVTLDTPYAGRPWAALPLETELGVRLAFVKERVPYAREILDATEDPGAAGGEPWRVVVLGERFTVEAAVATLWQHILRRSGAPPKPVARPGPGEAARHGVLKILTQNVSRYLKYECRYEASAWCVGRLVEWRSRAEALAALMPAGAVNPTTYNPALDQGDSMAASQAPAADVNPAMLSPRARRKKAATAAAVRAPRGPGPGSPALSPRGRKKVQVPIPSAVIMPPQHAEAECAPPHLFEPGSMQGAPSESTAPSEGTLLARRQEAASVSGWDGANPALSVTPLQSDITTAGSPSRHPPGMLSPAAEGQRLSATETMVISALLSTSKKPMRMRGFASKALKLEQHGLYERGRGKDDPIVVKDIPTFKPTARAVQASCRFSDRKMEEGGTRASMAPIARPVQREEVPVSDAQRAFVVSLTKMKARAAARGGALPPRTPDAAVKLPADYRRECELQIEGMIARWWAKLSDKRRPKASKKVEGDASAPAQVSTKPTLKLLAKLLGGSLGVPQAMALEVADAAAWGADGRGRKMSRSASKKSLQRSTSRSASRTSLGRRSVCSRDSVGSNKGGAPPQHELRRSSSKAGGLGRKTSKRGSQVRQDPPAGKGAAPPPPPPSTLTPLPQTDEMDYETFKTVMLERVAGGGRAVVGKACDVVAMLKGMFVEAFGDAAVKEILKEGEAFEQTQVQGVLDRRAAARDAALRRDDALDKNRLEDQRRLERAEMNHYLEHHVEKSERGKFFKAINCPHSTPFPALCDTLVSEIEEVQQASAAAAENPASPKPAGLRAIFRRGSAMLAVSAQAQRRPSNVAAAHLDAGSSDLLMRRLSKAAASLATNQADAGAGNAIAVSPPGEGGCGGNITLSIDINPHVQVAAQSLLSAAQKARLARLEAQREEVEMELADAEASANLMTGMLVRKKLADKLSGLTAGIRALEDLKAGLEPPESPSPVAKKEKKKKEKKKKGKKKRKDSNESDGEDWMWGEADVPEADTTMTTTQQDTDLGSTMNKLGSTIGDGVVYRAGDPYGTGSLKAGDRDIVSMLESRIEEKSNRSTKRVHFNEDVCFYGVDGAVEHSNLDMQKPLARIMSPGTGEGAPRVASLLKKGLLMSPASSRGASGQASEDGEMFPDPDDRSSSSREYSEDESFLDSDEEGHGVTECDWEQQEQDDEVPYPGGFAVLNKEGLRRHGGVMGSIAHALSDPLDETYGTLSSAGMFRGIDSSVDPNSTIGTAYCRNDVASAHSAYPPGSLHGTIGDAGRMHALAHGEEDPGGAAPGDSDASDMSPRRRARRRPEGPAEDADEVPAPGDPSEAAHHASDRSPRHRSQRAPGDGDGGSKPGGRARAPLYESPSGERRERDVSPSGSPRARAVRFVRDDDGEPVWLEPPPMEEAHKGGRVRKRLPGPKEAEARSTPPASPSAASPWPARSPGPVPPHPVEEAYDDPTAAKPACLPSLPPSTTLSPFGANRAAADRKGSGGATTAVVAGGVKVQYKLEALPRLPVKHGMDDDRVRFLLEHGTAFEHTLTAVAREPNLDKFARKHQALAMSALKVSDRNKPYLYRHKTVAETRRCVAVPATRLPALKKAAGAGQAQWGQV